MEPYADKLSYQERWEVIHYIRSLQAGTKKLEYTAAANTFNKEAVPMSSLPAQTQRMGNTSKDTTAMHRNAPASETNMNNH
jgi:hypothetical protein